MYNKQLILMKNVPSRNDNQALDTRQAKQIDIKIFCLYLMRQNGCAEFYNVG